MGLTGKEGYVLIIEKSPPSSEISPEYLDIHAGEKETGLMVNYFPDQVNAEMARTLKGTDFTLEHLMRFQLGWSDTKRLIPLGYFGNPAGFDKNRSRMFIEVRARRLADPIHDFLKGGYARPYLTKA